MQLPADFVELAKIFSDHGHNLFMVGGNSRDFLLGIPYDDFDYATDATPTEMSSFLEGADLTFSRLGCVRIKRNGHQSDITTFRIEGPYGDHRHPDFIEFTKDMEKDSIRRDFTINALYIDNKERVYDFHGGLEDLKNKVIRFIGDPRKRIEEDPLRIIRAERFAKRLGFQIEPETLKAMEELHYMIEKLNPDKVLMEKKKG